MSEQAQQWTFSAIKEVGFPVAVACFLLWLVNQQGMEMASRLDKMNDYVVVELSGQLRETTAVNVKTQEALVRCTQVIEQNGKMLETTTELLKQVLKEGQP